MGTTACRPFNQTLSMNQPFNYVAYSASYSKILFKNYYLMSATSLSESILGQATNKIMGKPNSLLISRPTAVNCLSLGSIHVTSHQHFQTVGIKHRVIIMWQRQLTATQNRTKTRMCYLPAQFLCMRSPHSARYTRGLMLQYW